MDRPNIILLVMDTARARDALGREDVMPNLNRIADEGVTFTNAFATGPWTMPSHASMFTGQYASDHGTHAGRKRFDPDHPPLAERLRTDGYQTVAFSNNTWVSPDFGFDRGFTDFFVGWELFESGADLAGIAKSHDDPIAQLRALAGELLSVNAPQTVLNAFYAQFVRRLYDDGALVTNWRFKRWVANRRTEDRPFFAFFNYLEPHLEYDPPERFREKFCPEGIDRSALDDVNQDAWAYICDSVEMDEADFEALAALYRGELSYLDHRIGRLYEYLDEADMLEETAIVIAGDHGENIGEHGLMDHQYCLYDTLLHVPLVIRYPELAEPRTEDGLVELRDLFPTILDLADCSAPSADGVSEADLLTTNGRQRVISEYLAPQPSMDALEKRVDSVPDSVRRYDRGLRSIRTEEWKYIEGTDRTEELYDVSDRSGERTDRAAERPDLCASFRSRLDRELGEISQFENASEMDVDDSTKNRLEELGYLQ